MWELDCEKDWALKNWYFWTVVLEKTLESPLDCKEIQPVHSKGYQFWDFFGRNDAKAETPVLWPPHAKSWLIGKDSDAGRDWGQKEKGMTKDEMAGWHHWLHGRESEWTPGVGDGQGGLACCDSWGRKESDMTERLNWAEITSDSLRYLGLQQTKTLYPSLSPGDWAISCPLSWWYYLTISFSTALFSSCPQSLPATGSFLIYPKKLMYRNTQHIGKLSFWKDHCLLPFLHHYFVCLQQFSFSSTLTLIPYVLR